ERGCFHGGASSLFQGGTGRIQSRNGCFVL
ncbi:uncharacterized protein METZ01_LOCUS494970, partial [marine metagenome]